VAGICLMVVGILIFAITIVTAFDDWRVGVVGG